MNRRETAEEPSMEDILASIRKIIADEPAATTATAALPLPQLSPVGFPPAPKQAQPSSPALPSPQPSLTARLNDVFGPGSIIPGDRPDHHHAPKPIPASRPLRSVMDDDLGDMLADTPQSAFKPTDQAAAPARPAPTVIAEPPARSRPFPLDAAASDLLAGRSPLPAQPGTPASDAPRFPQTQPSPYPPNARLTELRTTPQHQAPASFDTSPSFPPQTTSSQSEATRPGPVVIASMAPMEQRPLPAARPFNFAPGAPEATATPLHQAGTTAAPVQSAPKTDSPTAQTQPIRPEPIVIASSKPYTAQPESLAITTAPAAPSTPPSVAATLPPPASAPPAKPVGISASTLDFLMPSAHQTESAPAQLVAAPSIADSLPIAPIFTAATLDFLKPAAKPIDNNTVDRPAEPAPVAAVQPAPQPLAAAPIDVAAPPPSAPPMAKAPEPPALQAIPPAPVAAEAAPVESASIDPSVAVASALGALAAGLAASSREPIPEIVVSAVEVSRPKAPVQAGEPSVNTSLSATSGLSVFSSPDNFVGGTHLTPVSTSTLDDTAAELLRPMLRQWLDANMPRIVERALRIELTGAVTVPAKADGEE